MEENYSNTLKIRDNVIKYRKWKVKDKKKFKLAQKANDAIMSHNALVYDCIENKNVILTPEEQKFMLMALRSVSIGDTLEYTFNCDACEEDYDYTGKISELFIPEFTEYGALKSNSVEFRMGKIQSKEYYDRAMGETEEDEDKFLVDFLFHIKSLNDNDTMEFNELFEYVNNMEVDMAEEIFVQWKKMRFEYSEVKSVTCPHCGAVENYEFDTLPGFLPESWIV